METFHSLNIDARHRIWASPGHTWMAHDRPTHNMPVDEARACPPHPDSSTSETPLSPPSPSISILQSSNLLRLYPSISDAWHYQNGSQHRQSIMAGETQPHPPVTTHFPTPQTYLHKIQCTKFSEGVPSGFISPQTCAQLSFSFHF